MMSLAKANQIVEGFLSGPDITIDSVSTDSRTLDRGALYVAIHGEHFDGHDFIEKASLMGALAAMADREIESNIPVILVENTTIALGKLAAYWRQQFDIPVVGVTGSCGKTTVRAMLESIFSQQGQTLASPKSYNNEIGVPMTLLKLSSRDQFAVVEMGMNNLGELEQLTKIVQPDVAIVTCVAPVHLESLKTVEQVAAAKAEIFERLSPTGIAIINNDDAFADFFKKEAKDFKQITFAIENDADVTAKNIQFDLMYRAGFTLKIPAGEINIQLPLMGKHNVMNALAAAAAAVSQNLTLEQVKQGLEAVSSVERRLRERQGIHGSRVIDDSYNANPASMAVAIDILASRQGESVLVCGDMLELGEQAEEFHRQVGEKARTAGIAHLYCFGKLSELTAKAFGGQAQYFDDQAALIAALSPTLSRDSTVLVKGSNGMKMDNIVKAILEN